MALEAVVFSQPPPRAAGHFGYGRGDSPLYAAVPWCDLLLQGEGGFGDLCAVGDWVDHDVVVDTCWAAPAPTAGDDWADWEALSRDQSSDASTDHVGSRKKAAAPEPPAGRRKRRRAKVVKNKEEIESQRMTHIAVERNRRRQMNEYLAVLRSLMPPSYAHRGDQASIVGGAINYVRELEQLLQSLEVQKSIKSRGPASRGGTDDAAGSSPFAGFFSFPQYSTTTTSANGGCCSGNTSNGGNNCSDAAAAAGIIASTDAAGSRPAAVADIEVTMVEGHASLKVLARRRPKQLLKLVAGLHQLRIPPLHLNVTTVDAMVLYTFSLKVEDDSKMGSVEDIAAAVHEILRSTLQQRQEETAVM